MNIVALQRFGVELVGFSVRTASESDLQLFDSAFREHSFVLIRDPGMTADEQISLLSRLGPVAIEMPGAARASYIRHDPELSGSGTVAGADFGKGELAFHFDMSYTEDFPQWIVSLYAEKVPKIGGETRLLHAGLAYERLDAETQQAIEGRRAVHVFDQRKRLMRTREADVGTFALRGVHDLEWPHPYGHGKVLMAMDADTDRIAGLPREQGEALLQRLFNVLASPDLVYDHQWRVGDLMVWDNRVLQHARADFDPTEARVLRRVACGDEKGILLHIRNRIEQRM